MRTGFWLTALVSAALTARVAGAPDTSIPATVRELVVPAAEGAIALDGRPDEAAWASAPRVGPLVMIGSGGLPERDVTSCRLVHDEACLYLFVTCQGRPAPEVTIHRSGNGDWPHSRADRIEIFLSPAPDSTDQYHLDVDRAGGCYDALATERDVRDKGLSWNGTWTAAVQQTATGWTAEVRVPFATLGVQGVRPGDLWRFKIGRHNRARGDGPIMWPLNPTSSFGRRVADAALYFDRQDILPNGDFDAGEIVNGAPRPWIASITRNDAEVKGRPQGEVTTIEGGTAAGGRALRVVKTELNSNLPQVWVHDLRLAPGGVYEFSVLARGSLPNCCLRMKGRRGDRSARLGKLFTPSEEAARYAFRFVVPDGSEKVQVGLGVGRNVLGEVVYDDARLRRVLDSEEALSAHAKAFTPLTYDPPEDPVHGLEAFVERCGEKPWDLFEREDEAATQRLIFRDRRFGTEVWLLDHSPGPQYNTTATVWQPWNANGARLRAYGLRRLGRRTPKNWFYNADFTRLRPMPFSGLPVWDLEDPDVYYYFRSGDDKQVFKVHAPTGTETVLAAWAGPRGHRSHGMTKDNRALFVQDYNGGIWVPYEPAGDPLPVVSILDTSGRLWDEKTPFPSRAFATTGKQGPLFRIMTGMRVETDTGRSTRVVVPITGHTEYLKTFASGRVQFPKDAQLPDTKDLDELFGLYHMYPSTSHGHDSYSPDGEYICSDGTPSHRRVRDGRDGRAVRISPNGACYHVFWYCDPRFYVTSVAGYVARYQRPAYGGVACQAFSDGTWQPVVDMKLRTYSFSHYHGSDFATLSPDATKVVFASSMTGAMKLYVAVMARPQPPRRITWQAADGAVALRWAPPPHAREIRGYLVYRSDRSGDGYRLLTPEPTPDTAWRDKSVEPGRAYYYVVTSLEHCGLESGYSAEASRAGVELAAANTDPVVLYFEAEQALVDLGTGEYPGVSRGRDMRAASNGYYVYRTPEGCGDPKLEAGLATLGVHVPAAAAYRMWVRVRRGAEGKAAWSVTAGGNAVGNAECEETQWTWNCAGEADLAAGPSVVELSTPDAAAQADLICLTTDAAFVPQGPRPEDRDPPDPVAGLQSERVRARTARLTWRPCPAPDLSHYNVYASREPFSAPAQERRIASVAECEAFDWGLRPGTTYHYLVTAVDRRGNESQPGTPVAVGTAPRPTPEQRITLRFDQAGIEGGAERARGPGTIGEQYVIWPYDGPARDGCVPTVEGSSAEWQIDITHPGRFTFWLRFLARGQPAGDYTPEMKVSVPMRLDGQPLGRVSGGRTDLAITDKGIRPEWWTWGPPLNSGRLQAYDLPAGKHTLKLEGFPGELRCDVLVITDEPSWTPEDGRLRL